EPGMQRPGDLLRHRRLDGEHIGHVPIVATSPDMPVAARIDEACLYADAISGPLNAPLDDRRHAQCIGDLPQVARPLFVLEHRGARNDPQVANAGDLAEQLVVEALSEVRVFFAGAQVGEWQHGDGAVRVSAPVSDYASRGP